MESKSLRQLLLVGNDSAVGEGDVLWEEDLEGSASGSATSVSSGGEEKN